MITVNRKLFVGIIAGVFAITSIADANAHAGIDTRNGTPTKGVSSTVMLRIGHGCTAPDGVTKVATHSVSVVIPVELLASAASAAQQIPGLNAVVVTNKDASGAITSSTITWTAINDSFDINPVGFAEFGIRGSWATAGKFWLDTIQVCRIATNVVVPATIKTMTDPKTKVKIRVWVPESVKTTYQELKLSWTVHDSAYASTLNDAKTIETGPAPTITIS
ncbi:MAG: DUF1775 domain-containing protein [Actinobacteria bacterium]|nr:DUF1775 domain-containing protein [Actinomycetota bacterium]